MTAAAPKFFSHHARERPILFSAPMVRALLDGTKTQTRRVVRIPAGWTLDVDRGAAFVSQCRPGGLTAHKQLPCPYGVPGDRLWVRETWRVGSGNRGVIGDVAHYRADIDECAGGPWRPSIYMPRWASRITLEVTGIRAERLQDTSEADALAEGVVGILGTPHVRAYAALWDGINGKRPSCAWRDNPWVWAITLQLWRKGQR